MVESWLLTRETETPTSERLVQLSQWYSQPSKRQAETKATLDLVEKILLPVVAGFQPQSLNHPGRTTGNGQSANVSWQQEQQAGGASDKRQKS
jgi:hypothetical protein